MRNLMILLLSLLMTPGLIAEDWDVGAEVAAARALFERNLDAIRNQDREAYLSTYLHSERLARTGPGGISLGFADLEASAGSGWPDTFEGRDLDLVPVRPGVVYGTYRYRVVYGNTEQTGISERLFVETDDGWRIAVTTAFGNPPEVAPAPIAIVGGTLIDGTGGPAVTDAIVLIRDGLVECAGSREQCEPSADHAVIDASGKWITPGLIDAHVHYGQTGWADGRPDHIDVRETFPYEETIRDLREHPETIHRSLLCSGITAAFDVGGYAWSVDVKNDATGTNRVPSLSVAGPLLSSIEHDVLNLPGEKQIVPMTNPDQARRLVRYIHSLGSDAVKMWLVMRSGVDVEALERIVMAGADEADELEIPLIVHATELAPAKLALRGGAAMLVHSVGDQLVDDEFLQLLKANGSVYVPTATVLDGYLRMYESALHDRRLEIDDPNRCVSADLMDRIATTPTLASSRTAEQVAAMRERIDEGRSIELRNIATIAAAGGTIAVGTDAGNPLTLHGPSIYAELEAMELAGLAPAQILVMATRNGAKAMGRDDIGTVEAGKSADMLILDANPLESTRNFRKLSSVVLRGVVRGIGELRAAGR